MNELLQTLTPIQAAKYLGINEAALRLWGGWRRSGHKNWVQASSLSRMPQVSSLRPGRLLYSRITFTKMPSGSSPPSRWTTPSFT